MKKIIISSLIFSSVFIGCATKKAITPKEITKSFWQAEKKENFKTAQKFSFGADEEDVKLHKTIQIKDFKIGNFTQEGDKAEVKTTLFLQNPITETIKDQLKVDFNTTLLKDKKEWKVDIDETKRSLYAESAKQFSVDIFSTIKDKLGNLEILKNAFEKVIKEVAKDIKQ